MGSDWNYVTVDVTSASDRSAVREALRELDELDQRDRVHDDSLVVSGLGALDPVRERLHEVGDRLERVLLVHVYDTSTSTRGWYYERQGDELVEVDEFGMHGTRGAPVLDYFTREYGIPAPF